MPDSRPTFVGPRKTEGKIRFTRSEYFVEWPLEHPLSVTEPIVPIAEPFNAVFSGHRGLRYPSLGHPQIVVAEVRRNVRLIVPSIQRLRLGHVRPFGEPSAPPQVVLRDRMKLRQIECDETSLGHGGQVPTTLSLSGASHFLPGPVGHQGSKLAIRPLRERMFEALLSWDL